VVWWGSVRRGRGTLAAVGGRWRPLPVGVVWWGRIGLVGRGWRAPEDMGVLRERRLWGCGSRPAPVTRVISALGCQGVIRRGVAGLVLVCDRSSVSQGVQVLVLGHAVTVLRAAKSTPPLDWADRTVFAVGVRRFLRMWRGYRVVAGRDRTLASSPGGQDVDALPTVSGVRRWRPRWPC
jgi:hypothetical protein